MICPMRCIVTAILAISANVWAANSVDDIHIQVLNQSFTLEQKQSILDEWKASELSKVDSIPTIQFQHDSSPIGARETLARYIVEVKYNSISRELGLSHGL